MIADVLCERIVYGLFPGGIAEGVWIWVRGPHFLLFRCEINGLWGEFKGERIFACRIYVSPPRIQSRRRERFAHLVIISGVIIHSHAQIRIILPQKSSFYLQKAIFILILIANISLFNSPPGFALICRFICHEATSPSTR